MTNSAPMNIGCAFAAVLLTISSFAEVTDAKTNQTRTFERAHVQVQTEALSG
ncbi:MAG: hypothetical protein V2I43_09360 [Parvularcula sp.]|jgi:hypothetical protein|nr:hypothetical protein [Parvularcula sp.]